MNNLGTFRESQLKCDCSPGALVETQTPHTLSISLTLSFFLFHRHTHTHTHRKPLADMPIHVGGRRY